MNNYFFISGPHGAGKTTLTKKLTEIPGIVFPDINVDYGIPNLTSFNRLKMKVLQRIVENVRVIEEAQSNPDKIYIGNRSICDDLVYTQAHLRRGWISYLEGKQVTDFIFSSYPEMIKKAKTVIYNPGFEVVWSRIRKRSEEEPDSLKEDRHFCEFTCSEFENFVPLGETLKLSTPEVDLNKILDFIGYK